MFLRFAIVLTLAMTLVSCESKASGKLEATPSPPATNDDSSLRVMDSVFESPIFESPITEPTPMNTAFTLAVPSPKPGTGIIYGMLAQQGKTQAEGNIYLGTLVKTDDANLSFTRLNPDEDIKASQFDPNGSFIFTDVPPGDYNLVFWDDNALTPVVRIDTGEIVSVSVTAGEVINLNLVSLP
jgi:hypothetical protein